MIFKKSFNGLKNYKQLCVSGKLFYVHWGPSACKADSLLLSNAATPITHHLYVYNHCIKYLLTSSKYAFKFKNDYSQLSTVTKKRVFRNETLKRNINECDVIISSTDESCGVPEVTDKEVAPPPFHLDPCTKSKITDNHILVVE